MEREKRKDKRSEQTISLFSQDDHFLHFLRRHICKHRCYWYLRFYNVFANIVVTDICIFCFIQCTLYARRNNFKWERNWGKNLFRNIVGQLRPRHYLKTFLLAFKIFVLRCLQYDFIGKFLLYDVNIESLIKLPTSFNLQRSIAFWNSIKYSSRPICVCPRRQRFSLKSPTKKHVGFFEITSQNLCPWYLGFLVFLCQAPTWYLPQGCRTHFQGAGN